MSEASDNVRRLRATAEDIPPPGPPDEGPPQAPVGEDGLPHGCPIVPLGHTGQIRHYLDAVGTLVSLDPKGHSRHAIKALYGPAPDLADFHFPRWKKTGDGWEVAGFKAEIAADALMGAAARKGAWDVEKKLRGAGAWKGENGELILHVGDGLVVIEGETARVEPAGPFQAYLYPTLPACPRPAESRQPSGPGGPGASVLALLSSWSWRRPEIDPYLVLGWIGAAMIGGATDWRAVAWITGDYGTGKSALQEFIKHLFGGKLVQSPDATAAGIRQTVRYNSLPVLVDEAEPDPRDPRMGENVIKLARNAATGSEALRGSSEHSAASFVLRASFLFSSILVPPLLPQDRSRIAVFELGPLPKGPKPRGLVERNAKELGVKLLRRMADGWGRLEETVQNYHAEMAERGYSARGADVYGTLLACADLLLHDAAPASDDEEQGVGAWLDKLEAAGILAGEQEEHSRNRCLEYLLSSYITDDRRERTAGEWIARATNRFIDPTMNGPVTLDHDEKSAAVRVLAKIGLRPVAHEGQTWIAVANSHRQLATLFRDTEWGSRSGLDGGWAQALRRLPGASARKGLRIGGLFCRVTLLPIDAAAPIIGSPADAAGSSPRTASASDLLTTDQD